MKAEMDVEEIIDILRFRNGNKDSYGAEIMVSNIANDFSSYFQEHIEKFDSAKFHDAIFSDEEWGPNDKM